MSGRVLLSYFFRPDFIPLGYACLDAFESLGWTTQAFDSQIEHPLKPVFKPPQKLIRFGAGLGGIRDLDITAGTRLNDQHYREHRLRTTVAEFRPDTLLVIRGNGYSADFLRELKLKYGIERLIGWWVKDPRSDRQMIEDAKAYDYYFCIHGFGYSQSDNIHRLPAMGVFDKLYRPAFSRAESELTHDIVLVGGKSLRRQTYLQPLLKSNLPLELYGPGWRAGTEFFNPIWKKALKARGIWGEAMVDLYQHSKIVINVTSWDPAQLGGQNLRIFDVPSTGAFLLTDYSNELQEFFKAGQEIETFASPEELADKADYYLRHPIERERIALAGLQRSRSLPTIRNRIESMLKLAT